jgi:hypothetical protein
MVTMNNFDDFYRGISTMPAEPTVRINDDKRGQGCHAVIDPNEYAPITHVHFETRTEAEQWLANDFPGWYRRYKQAA